VQNFISPQNKALSRISGSKSKEDIGGWRKIHNLELHNLYPTPIYWGVKMKYHEMSSTPGNNVIQPYRTS
jgi:hypothetical protein